MIGCPARVEVANRVEHLVADELVLVAQALVIEHTVVVDHDRVLQASTPNQIHRTQTLDVREKPEGAGPAHVADERTGRKVQRRVLALPAEERMVVVHRVLDAETRRAERGGPMHCRRSSKPLR